MWTRIEMFSAVAASLGVALGIVGTEAPPRTVHMAADTAEVSFAEEIMPMLKARCVECHGSEDADPVRLEAGLNLTSYEHVMLGSEFGSVVEPGDADGSMMIVLIEDGDMPEEGDPVTPEELAKLRTWITEGAKNN